MASKRPYYVYFSAYIKRVWNPKGVGDVFSRDNGFFLIKFDLEMNYNRILKGGPWFMDSKLIIMKKWEANFNFEKAVLTLYPVWMKLNNLNLALWNTSCISKLASIIGTPLDIDESTRLVKRIKFVRVLIEMKASSPLPTSIKAVDKHGNIYTQEAEYEYVPPIYTECNCFGHTSIYCNNYNEPPKQIWVEKAKFNPTVSSTDQGSSVQHPKNDDAATKNST